MGYSHRRSFRGVWGFGLWGPLRGRNLRLRAFMGLRDFGIRVRGSLCKVVISLGLSLWGFRPIFGFGCGFWAGTRLQMDGSNLHCAWAFAAFASLQAGGRTSSTNMKRSTAFWNAAKKPLNPQPGLRALNSKPATRLMAATGILKRSHEAPKIR